MRAPDALEHSQRKLFLAIQSELELFEKRRPRHLRDYERAFRAALPRRATAISKPALLRSARDSRVVLVGDFHPFRQSQKGFLRLVEEARRPGARHVLALECIPQIHQVALQEFLSGFITAEELRDKIDFERHWPFSWENYKEILVFARRHRFQLLALNVSGGKRDDRETLRARDRAAAEKITHELRARVDAQVFVLYGELHLGRAHLPRELRQLAPRGTRVLTVHQNLPELYWKSPKQRNGQKPEVLRLGTDEYCIQSSVPWVKLRSYLDWLEGDTSAEDWPESSDVPGLVHHYAGLLAEALGTPAPLREDTEILGPESLRSGRLPPQLRRGRSAELSFARHALRFRKPGYVPSRGLLILPSLSTNSLSEAAAYLLWHSLAARPAGTAEVKAPGAMAHFFVGYLGSKVLNPKRKCNELRDLLRLASAGRRASIARRALQLLRPYLKRETGSARQPALPAVRELEACRLAGYVLGEKFFVSLLMEPGLVPLARAWFQCDSPQAEKVLLAETSAKIGKARLRPGSKHDRF